MESAGQCKGLGRGKPSWPCTVAKFLVNRCRRDLGGRVPGEKDGVWG